MNNELSLYVHIPFCVRKCLYCDFLSFGDKESLMEDYFKALSKELKEGAGDYRDREVKTVFFGGGTPSLPKAEYICDILSDIKENYRLSENAEISLELNPGTASFDKMRSYKDAGFNRLSIGIQSFNDEELKKLGRIHDSATALRTYEDARRAGFDNINIDIMSALPGQSVESYLNTLSRAVKLSPEHISAYSLIIEEGTPFFDMDLDLPNEEADRDMYHKTAEMLLEHGYHRYEISNYAKDGFECRHNKVYWKRGDYLGVGLGAASLIDNVRFNNTRDLKEYLTSSDIIKRDTEELSVKAQMEEFMFLGLRLTEGIRTADFKREFGKTVFDVYDEVIDKYLLMTFLELCDEDMNITDDKEKTAYLKLSEQGLDVCNTIMADFLF
ncbi:MAG: oxygen-independent coproporphyrinogen III oxidase [Butyrivibrio sp.]|nr:oxygen-independent coproporphyrinogen III oxidase [Butyrivibrio sp.]